MLSSFFGSISIFGIILLIGLTSGFGDIFLYKWAKTNSMSLFGMSCLCWLVSIVLLGVLFKLERFTFAVAIVFAAVIHLVVDVGWEWFIVGDRPDKIQVLGVLTGVTSIVLFEISRSLTESPSE